MKACCLLLVSLSWAASIYGQSAATRDRHTSARETKAVPAHRSGVKPPTVIPVHPAAATVKRPHQDRGTNSLANATGFNRPGTSGPAGVAGGIASRPAAPIHAPTVAGLSGQQFRDAHSRRAGPAIIGGPTIATKNTAAIGGALMVRKH
jgi:hypothetical protein